MKIVVAPRFDAGEEALALMREVARVTVLDDGSEAVLLEELRDADTLLVGIEPGVIPRLIESAPRLKHIARQGVGVDIVDVQAATERGIFVTNVPRGEWTRTMGLLRGSMSASFIRRRRGGRGR